MQDPSCIFENIMVKFDVKEEDFEPELLRKCRAGAFDEIGLERAARMTNMNKQLRNNGYEPLHVFSQFKGSVSRSKREAPAKAVEARCCIKEKYMKELLSRLSDEDLNTAADFDLEPEEYAAVKGSYGTLLGRISLDEHSYNKLIKKSKKLLSKMEKEALMRASEKRRPYNKKYKLLSKNEMCYDKETCSVLKLLKSIAQKKLELPETIKYIRDSFCTEENLKVFKTYLILRKFSPSPGA